MSPIERGGGGGGGGTSLTVTDGTTSVASVGTIDFTSGATVTNAGGGQANVAISASSIGSSLLIYRFTVTGADKASIDTGVDAAQAGSNDWTNGDLLEIYMSLRTDGAGQLSAQPVLTFNNDSGANYDLQVISGQNATAAAACNVAQASFGNLIFVHGSGGTAQYAGPVRIIVPDFAGTTFWKSGEIYGGSPDVTASQNIDRHSTFGWRSTSAITRFAVAGGGGEKLKVGSQVLIYKRLAS